MITTKGRSAGNQSLHNNVVKQLADRLKADGWSVHADHIHRHTQPRSMFNHIPDIHAFRLKMTRAGRVRADENGNPILEELIIEVETEDSITTEHARKQCRAFQRFADLNDNRTFKIVQAKP